MEYRVLEIPGGTTINENRPTVTVLNHELSRPDLMIRYATSSVETAGARDSIKFAELMFHSVVEYRWVESEFSYPHFDDEIDDPTTSAFTLLEVIDSKWIEEMRLKSWYLRAIRENPGTLRNIAIVHFRLTFDEYGTFDILAKDYSAHEVDEGS